MMKFTLILVLFFMTSCILTESGMVEYQVVGDKKFVVSYIDKNGILQDTLIKKESFTYKFLGDPGDKVGASAVPVEVNGGLIIKVKFRGNLIADGGSTVFLQPALAFSILK